MWTYECPNGHQFDYRSTRDPKWCPGCGTSTISRTLDVVSGARCQHCPTAPPADERSFMCTDCAVKADTDLQNAVDRADRLAGEVERLKAESERRRRLLDNASGGYRRIPCSGWPSWVRPVFDELDRSGANDDSQETA